MKTTTNTTTQTPTATFMAGAAGAGKGYVRNNDETLKSLPVVDADQFKSSHPDYDPKDPGALHVWSSNMANRAFFKALGEGQSFIYDGTGTKAAKYVKMISEARSAGFAIEVVYVKVSLETSLDRNAKRERNVPVDVVHEQHELIGTSMIIIAEHADTFRVIRND